MLKLRAIYTPQVYKDDASGRGYVDGEPETVMIIQIKQFDEIAASVIFVDESGNIKEDFIHRFGNIEGAWRP